MQLQAALMLIGGHVSQSHDTVPWKAIGYKYTFVPHPVQVTYPPYHVALCNTYVPAAVHFVYHLITLGSQRTKKASRN